MTLKEIEKYHDKMQDFTYKCKCGHGVVISPKKAKELCKYCGNYVYRNQKEEFIDKLGGYRNGFKENDIRTFKDKKKV